MLKTPKFMQQARLPILAIASFNLVGGSFIFQRAVFKLNFYNLPYYKKNDSHCYLNNCLFKYS